MFRKKDNVSQSSASKGASRKGATFKRAAKRDSVEKADKSASSVVHAKVSSKPSSASKADKGKRKVLTSGNLSSKTSVHFNYHKQCANSSWNRLLGNRLAAAMTASLIAVSLALPMLLLIVVSNLQQLSSGWQDQLSFSVYLNSGIHAERSQSITQDVIRLEGVESARLISPDEGLQEFKALAGAELLSLFDRNPLPPVIELIPNVNRDELDTSFKLAELVRSIEAMNGVDEVVYDVEWVERLLSYVELSERFALLIGCLLSLAVVLAISNSIRLEIENRRQEIIVIKLVGGTDSFIRLPFLYSGFWYGVLGAGLATLSLLLISLWLSPLVGQLLSLYSSEVMVHYLRFSDVIGLFVVAILLSVAGAWLAVYRHLGEIEPE